MRGDQDQEQRPFTPKTLAARWLCSERQIRNLITQGKLPAFKVGGKLLRIRWADAMAFENRPAVDQLSVKED